MVSFSSALLRQCPSTIKMNNSHLSPLTPSKQAVSRLEPRLHLQRRILSEVDYDWSSRNAILHSPPNRVVGINTTTKEERMRLQWKRNIFCARRELRMDDQSITSLKAAFIGSQVRHLSTPLEPSTEWRDQATEPEGGHLSDKVVQDVVAKGMS